MKGAGAAFNVKQSKMYACYARVLAGPSRWFSVVGSMAVGGSARSSCRALPFSAFCCTSAYP